MTLTTSLARLFALLPRRRRWQLVGLFFLMLVSALAEMATLGAIVPFLAMLADPMVFKKYMTLQTVLYWFGADVGNVLLYAGILFCMITISAAMIRMFMMWSSMRYSYGLGADIGSEVYRRTLYQKYSWHVSQNSSEVLAGIDKVNTVVGEVLTPILQGIVAFFMVIGILVMLLSIDWQTALISGVAFTVIYGITTLMLRNKVKSNSQIISSNMSRRVQSVQEGLGGIRDVLLDGTQLVYQRRYAGFDYAVRRAQASNAVIGASPRYIIEAVGMVLIVALAYWLSNSQNGLAGAIPVLGALAIGAQKLMPQMQLVYLSMSSINGSRKQMEDVISYLSMPLNYLNYQEPPEIGCKKNNTRNQVQSNSLVNNGKPILSLNEISFSYSADAVKVLRDVNFDISQGSIIGIIGKTGSGKSTLMDIIMGLLEPTSGVIKVFNSELNGENIRQWQLRVAHVPQNIYLSDGTIAENIAFGVAADKIDIDKIKEVSSKAQLTHFIEQQPLGYQTTVGERGVRLSGGQRQRIGLARALYKKADVLVLDEATSALDSATEKSIMMAIERLGKHYTIIIVAHRISTLSICDDIIEIRDGSIARRGSYRSINI